MKKIIIILIGFLIMLPTSIIAKSVNKETMEWRYEVQDINKIGKQGTCVFKIWTYAKNEKKAIQQAGKNAVHAVIFKGFGNYPALVPGAETYEENKVFFDSFFKDGGEYQLYVQFSNNGAIAPADKIKLKNEYKIGVTVIVRKDALREALEKAGIITSASSLF